MKKITTIDDVLTAAGITRKDHEANMNAAALAPARVDSRATVRNCRDPLNQYDPQHKDREAPHSDTPTLRGTVVPQVELPEPSPEQEQILTMLNEKAAARFRQQFGLRPLAV